MLETIMWKVLSKETNSVPNEQIEVRELRNTLTDMKDLAMDSAEKFRGPREESTDLKTEMS